MFGRIVIEPAQPFGRVRTVLDREQLCGVSFLLGRVYFSPRDSESRRRRILGRLSRTMAGAGIRQAILPPGFPYTRELAAQGILPFPVLGLYRALAPQLSLAGLRETGTAPEAATVALSGLRMERTLWQSALNLSRQVRYLVVDVDDDGGAALRRALRDRCGLPALNGGMRRADFTLYYHSITESLANPPGFLLCPDTNRYPEKPFLYRGAALRLAQTTEALPPDCSVGPVLAALYELGRIRTNQIAVERLTETTEALSVPDPG